MPIFITQGRYTRDAIKGMIARPEDRSEATKELFATGGGRLISYYMTFGEYDFLVIAEGPNEGVATAVIVAAASGGVTDLKTTLALTGAEMKNAFAQAGPIAASFRAAGSS